MNCRVAFLVLALLAAFGGPQAHAAEGVAEVDAGFVVERIEITGLVRASEEIVLREAGLLPGRRYAERELQEALGRMRRLPFLRAVELALARGGAEGSVVLEVTVTETIPFFAVLDGGLLFSSDNYRSPDVFWDSESRELIRPELRGQVGGRIFVGAAGELFAAAGVGDLLIGFRSYELFGDRVSAAVTAQRQLACCDERVWPLALDPELNVWSVPQGTTQAGGELRFALPARSQSILLRAGAGSSEEDLGRFPAFGELQFDGDTPARLDEMRWSELSIGWESDTTDDPLLPRRGSTFAIGLARTELAAREEDFDSGARDFDSSYDRLTLEASRNWAVAAKGALFARGRVAAGRSTLEGLALLESPGRGSNDALELEVEAGFRRKLREQRSRDSRPELWLELGVGAARESIDARGDGGAPRRTFDALSVKAALVLRTTWGVARFALTAVDWDGYQP